MKLFNQTTKTVAPKKPMDRPQRSRRGLGIVELGLYLIVVSLLVSAVVVAFYQLQTNSKQSQVTSMVNQAYTAVQDLHRSATTYGADDVDLVVLLEGAEMVPPIGRRQTGATDATVHLYTPFGQRITIVAGGTVGTEDLGQTFTIALAGYTKANCIDFMSDYIDRTLEQSGLVGAKSGASDAFTFPLTVATVNSGCADGILALEYR